MAERRWKTSVDLAIENDAKGWTNPTRLAIERDAQGWTNPTRLAIEKDAERDQAARTDEVHAQPVDTESIKSAQQAVKVVASGLGFISGLLRRAR